MALNYGYFGTGSGSVAPLYIEGNAIQYFKSDGEFTLALGIAQLSVNSITVTMEGNSAGLLWNGVDAYTGTWPVSLWDELSLLEDEDVPFDVIVNTNVLTLSGTEYGTLDTPPTFSGDWSVIFDYQIEDQTQALQFITTVDTYNRLNFQLDNNDVELIYGDTTATWRTFQFTSSVNLKDGLRHKLHIYKDGTDVSVSIYDYNDTTVPPSYDFVETVTHTVDLFRTGFTKTFVRGDNLSNYFKGKVYSLIFADDGDPVQSYVFDSGSTVEEESEESASNTITYTNVDSGDWSSTYFTAQNTLSTSWIIQQGASETYLEYLNNNTPRYTDVPAVPAMTRGYPRTILSEGPQLNLDYITVADLRKYDAIHSHAFAMSTIVAVQDGWSQTDYIRQVNFEFLDGLEAPDDGTTMYQARNPTHLSTGAVSGLHDGVMFAGHWLYRGYTTLTGYISSSATTINVTAGSKITAGRYVCIHDGDWRNAEHLYVNSVSGNQLTVSKRGYRSDAVSHNADSHIATHVLGATLFAENFLYNMSTACPEDNYGSGRKCNDWFAEWMAENNTRDQYGDVVSGLTTNGGAVDIDFKDQIHAADYDNSGSDDPGADINSAWLWDGIDDFFAHHRSYATDITIAGGLSRSPGYGHSHGTQEEGWPVDIKDPHDVVQLSSYSVFDEVMSNYILRFRESVSPDKHGHICIKNTSLIFPEGTSASDNKSLRFALTTALMGGAMLGQQPGYTGTPRPYDPWFDEYSVNINTGVALKSGTWYEFDGTPDKDAIADVYNYRYWLGQPLGDFERDFIDSDFDADDVLIDEPMTSTTGWTGTNITLSVDDSAIKCSGHTSYDSNKTNTRISRSTGFPLKVGNRYTVTFKARATTYREIFTYTGWILNEFVITDEWRNYSYCFQASGTNMAFYIGLGLYSTEVWFKDLKVYGRSDIADEHEINAFKREFEHGIILANGNYSSHTFNLPANTYQKIEGFQDSTVNDGTDVGTSITIPHHDGIFLIRKPV